MTSSSGVGGAPVTGQEADERMPASRVGLGGAQGRDEGPEGGAVMSAMQEQTVTLRIRRPADGTSPAEWNWPDLIDEPDVLLVEASAPRVYEDTDQPLEGHRVTA